jgi:hypothetical protein
MERFYMCEDGNDNGIISFKSAFKAILFAKTHKNVREIFEYVRTDDEDIECVGLIWKRN